MGHRAAGLLLLCATSCAGPLQHGKDLYANGRYVDAAQVFERSEHRLRSLSNEERAHYGLYRGATLWALGDVHGAAIWFSYAQKIQQSSPGSLSANESRELAQGLMAAQQRLEAPVPTSFALAGPAPAPPPAPSATPSPANGLSTSSRRSLVSP